MRLAALQYCIRCHPGGHISITGLRKLAVRPEDGDGYPTAPPRIPLKFNDHRSFREKFATEASGAWGRIRTTDTRIFNPLLYQLSYPGPRRTDMPFAEGGPIRKPARPVQPLRRSSIRIAAVSTAVFFGLAGDHVAV